MSAPEASVIISFYRNIDFLKLVLAGFEIQTHKSFEIIVADDGSSKEICKELSELIHKSDLKIQHIWHEDKGWRKNRILNKAIISSNSEYLIFADGDCIPHPRFVEEHIKNRARGIVLTGRRVYLSGRITKKLNQDSIRKKYLSGRYLLPLLVHNTLLKDGKFFENAIYFRSKHVRKLINKKEKGLMGSNFSIFKDDILIVNGFDEQYTAPSVGEDTDLDYRLRLAGIKVKTVKHIAVQYHLYHPRLDWNNRNIEIFNNTVAKGEYFAKNGIENHKI
jgi:glycosyltransferase involved in cell wall biosynthesis